MFSVEGYFGLSNWRFGPETLAFLGPERFCWPTLDIYHTTKYSTWEHFGLSLEDFLFVKRPKNLKRTCTILRAPDA